MPLLEDVANKMAARTLKLIEDTGNEDLEKQVADQIGASSPTLQEAFTTALRILKAEHRAAKFIDNIEAKAGLSTATDEVAAEPVPEPKPAPEPEPLPEPEPAPEPEPVPEPEPDVITLADEFDDEDEDEEELIALPSPTPGRSKGRRASRALSRLPDL